MSKDSPSPSTQNQVIRLWVILALRSHPFPSRTRKLSSTAPMVLRGPLRGRVGSRPIKSKRTTPVEPQAPGVFVLLSELRDAKDVAAPRFLFEGQVGPGHSRPGFRKMPHRIEDPAQSPSVPMGIQPPSDPPPASTCMFDPPAAPFGPCKRLSPIRTMTPIPAVAALIVARSA